MSLVIIKTTIMKRKKTKRFLPNLTSIYYKQDDFVIHTIVTLNYMEVPVKKYILILAVALFFNSCNEYYQKFQGDYGYSDLSYNSTIEVTFVGHTSHTVTDVKKLAIVRMAEIAYEKKHKYIQIESERVSSKEAQVTSETKTTCNKNTDSTGQSQVEVVTVPGNSYVVSKPVVTITGTMSETKDSESISVDEVLARANEEGITTSAYSR